MRPLIRDAAGGLRHQERPSKQGEESDRGHLSERFHQVARVGYSLQANAKVREGTNHPDRNAQFEYINAQAEAFLAANEPVISVDAKKKELLGDFKERQARVAAEGRAGARSSSRLH